MKAKAKLNMIREIVCKNQTIVQAPPSPKVSVAKTPPRAQTPRASSSRASSSHSSSSRSSTASSSSVSTVAETLAPSPKKKKARASRSSPGRAERCEIQVGKPCREPKHWSKKCRCMKPKEERKKASKKKEKSKSKSRESQENKPRGPLTLAERLRQEDRREAYVAPQYRAASPKRSPKKNQLAGLFGNNGVLAGLLKDAADGKLDRKYEEDYREELKKEVDELKKGKIGKL